MHPSIANNVMLLGRLADNKFLPLGTAFAVGPNRFATAAHAVGQNETGLCLAMPKIASLDDYQDTADQQINSVRLVIVAYDPVRDIAILEAPEATVQFGYTLDGAEISPPGTPIVSVGFPHANYGRFVLTQQTSTVGARVLLAAGPLKVKHLILNIQTRPGQSGSPVFIAGQNRVCAMVIGSYAPQGGGGISLGGIDPSTLHQTTHAISVEYIKAML